MNVVTELRHALRGLAKNPGFTLAATATLALGIGSTVAIFGVVDAVLLRPLPYASPERLHRVGSLHAVKNPDGLGASYPDFLDWKERTRAFDALGGFMLNSAVLGGAGSAARVDAAWVSADLLPALGVEPVAGRLFRAEEDRPEGDTHVALLTRGAWQTRFGSDPSIVGRAIPIDGAPFLVLGIVPDEPLLLGRAGVLMPLVNRAFTNRSGRAVDVVGRLAPGATTGSARGDMASIARALAREYPEADAGFSIAVVPLHESLFGGRRPALAMLFGAVGLLLVIACANTANLLIARTAARRHELAVRAALGASRARLARQLLAEAAVLAALAGTAGVLMAGALLEAIRAIAGSGVAAIDSARLDARVAGFAAAASAATILLFGLLPALTASRRAIGLGLRASTRGGGERHRAIDGLVLVQTALCLVLLVGAALFGRSYLALARTDLGLSPENVIAAEVTLPTAIYPDQAKRAAFVARMNERLAGLPGVSAAGITLSLPGENTMTVSFTPEGHPVLSRAESPQAELRPVSAGSFAALGVPVLDGRAIDERDRADAPPVIVVNRLLASRIWPGSAAVGRHVTLFSDGVQRLVVGVVGDVRSFDGAARAAEQLYLPFAQDTLLLRGFQAVVRAKGEPGGLAASIEKVIHEIDPGAAVSDVRTLSEHLSRGVVEPRFRAILVGAFAGAALLLASIGLYGVVAYAVARRRFEIGVRMALGATPGAIRRLFVSRALRLAGTGAALGAVASFPATRVVSGLLFGVAPGNPAVLLAAIGVLIAVAAAAADIPSRRAARTDPLTALRPE